MAILGINSTIIYAFYQIYLALYAGFIIIALIYILEISSENLRVLGPICIFLGNSFSYCVQPVL